MLHLFNKVYLEFDDRIEINLDRVVISEEHGYPMHQLLDKVSYGELLAHGKTYQEVIGVDLNGFISSIKSHGDTTGKKVVIYCDKHAYKSFIAQWFKVILPNLDFDGFKTIIDYTMYNQRVTSNTQLSSVHSLFLNTVWEGLTDIEEAWEEASTLSEEQLQLIKNLDLNYSYEFLLASHLSGDDTNKNKFKKTLHTFLRRWFKELLSDNRQMVLLNLSNHRFLKTFNIDPESIDLTNVDPLNGIEGFEAYSDDEIWERDENQYGLCKLEGISEEQANSLMSLLMKVYGDFEGMQLDRSVFSLDKYIGCTTRSTITDEELEELVTFVVNNPFDTCLVPRFDFQNVNFPLIQFFLSQKFNDKDLSKYRLI